MSGHGEKLTAKQESLIGALLTEPTHAAAATKAGVSEATVGRWLRLPAFKAAYRRARRELVERAVCRMQAGTGQAVDALVAVAKDGAKDSDRVRAAVALLDYAFRGLPDADELDVDRPAVDASPMTPPDLVRVLAVRLRQLDATELPTGEKVRLTATLGDALLRAIGVAELAGRLDALQAVLLDRKDREP